MKLPPDLEVRGALWWVTEDYSAPNLSKASLGLFMYEVLKEGGYIGEIWAFNHKYDRSAVYFSVYMTTHMKENIEARTKFRFRLPPVVKVNSND